MARQSEPYMTRETCTDPTCNGSCTRTNHPYASPVMDSRARAESKAEQVYTPPKGSKS